ncbi:importin subunit alpha-3-like [Drosophila gunungcola]|uniref:Importin alpha n=1 Tax=Drosophila gunungcola TaxID=103775 RepID=A0A9Q0BQQ8_9MUSC|nr:importin subunit alpha-3-like [Drosophila gunungcola]KAI8040309.1 hypothetical protein M5D96_006249 [Drosophila gunungcola]
MPANRLNLYLKSELHYLMMIIQAAGDATKPQKQLSAVQEIRLLVCSESPPINDLIENGVLPVLVECLKESGHKSLRYEAAWSLSNLASGNSEQTTQVVAAGAVPYFLELLKSPDLDLCEQAVWGLGNIIGDGPLLRDFVIRLGVVPPLLSLVQQDMPYQFLRSVTLAIGNLCRHYDPPISAETIDQILPTLNVLIHHEDVEILKGTLWAISFLADGQSGSDPNGYRHWNAGQVDILDG